MAHSGVASVPSMAMSCYLDRQEEMTGKFSLPRGHGIEGRAGSVANFVSSPPVGKAQPSQRLPVPEKTVSEFPT